MFEFSLTSYGDMLSHFSKNHRVRCFRDFASEIPDDGWFLMRHDVDFCPVRALRMAEYEAKKGICATYFILPHSAEYNILSPEHIEIPGKIAALGHEVGLHYDNVVIEQITARTGETPEKIVSNQAGLLSDITGTKVISIAPHNPSLSGKDAFMPVDGYVSAYDPRFTTRATYISDSCGAWRDSTVDVFNSPIPNNVHILVHPFFWISDSASRYEKLSKFTAEGCAAIEARHAEIARLWHTHPGVIEHDSRKGKGEGPKDD